MIKFTFLLFSLVSLGCETAKNEQPVGEQNLPQRQATAIYKTIGSISVPEGYTREPASAGSFGAWLRAVPLKKDKTVYLYNGRVKPNQSAQFAVIDIPVGKKDLQQCADVVMRLRAEYLYAQQQSKEIAFMDYSGKWYTWPGGANRQAFDNYLQNVFGWCGSASLEKQLKPVGVFSTIKAGDVLIKGGFPGHAMTVVDIAINEKGKKVFMLVQGYQPAQDMHLLINPINEGLSPWYEIPEGEVIDTPEWVFRKSNLKAWE